MVQFLQKDKIRGAVPRVMQQEKGQLQGGLRYLGQLFKQLQVSILRVLSHLATHIYVTVAHKYVYISY